MKKVILFTALFGAASASAAITPFMSRLCVVGNFNDKKVELKCGTDKISIPRASFPANKEFHPGKKERFIFIRENSRKLATQPNKTAPKKGIRK